MTAPVSDQQRARVREIYSNIKVLAQRSNITGEEAAAVLEIVNHCDAMIASLQEPTKDGEVTKKTSTKRKTSKKAKTSTKR